MNLATILALIALIILGIAANYFYMTIKVKIALKETISNLIDETMDSICPCKLIATIRYNQKIEQSIIDMSRYETLGMVGLTIDKIGEPPGPQEQALDGKATIYNTAVVYNMGGHWFWKIL